MDSDLILEDDERLLLGLLAHEMERGSDFVSLNPAFVYGILVKLGETRKRL